MSIELTPFANTPSPFVVTVDVRNRLDMAFVEFSIRGNAELLAPVEDMEGRQEELWQNTCVELFTKERGKKSYREYNFSLSGAWNCYDFSDYRKDQSLPSIEEPDVMPRLAKQCQRLSIVIPWSEIDGKECNIAAVVKLSDGSYLYFAPTHTADKPDFHDPQAFTVTFDGESFNVPENTGQERMQGIMNAIQQHNNS